MDKIEVVGIEGSALIGVGTTERSRRQRLVVDVSVEADLTAAAASDRFSETIDYVRIVKLVEQLLAEREFCLVESVAGTICDLILAWDRAAAVSVRVKKFPKTLQGRVDHVAVRIQRRRPGLPSETE